ncbi:MAG: hypothetical protein K9J12_17225 [Melioribacteraceae bacterium]|nr:hypothetical protein [Melioribacteraceae bacterium]MCF8264675.1 hypothetical protein [Melioribacteraceae bacterium]MCF8431597.1 hypothetical protein [Melioribacteraceae bacterium]
MKIEYDFNRNIKDIKVILLFEDDRISHEPEDDFATVFSKNPAFDFLKEPGEDIYSISDGVPLDD